MGMFRIADNEALEIVIKQIADAEERSEAKVREMLLREAVTARGHLAIGLDSSSVPETATARPEKKSRLAQPKNKRVPKEIKAVASCPHGYAIGMCKKVECNRRYQK